ncbi:hypothetical protein [Tomitella gaofuii]|uniref:hypothetical protein n=1 Tax=Tomitella gaofuii TaxID=2760083 RepID=UPI0015F9BF96|nr:hypothetical protein [Tomitella gaofuii]
MSEERYEAIAEQLLSIALGTELVDESRSSAAEPMDRAESEGAAVLPAPELDPAAPEALEEFVRDYERKWADESGPAAGDARAVAGRSCSVTSERMPMVRRRGP